MFFKFEHQKQKQRLKSSYNHHYDRQELYFHQKQVISLLPSIASANDELKQMHTCIKCNINSPIKGLHYTHEVFGTRINY